MGLQSQLVLIFSQSVTFVLPGDLIGKLPTLVSSLVPSYRVKVWFSHGFWLPVILDLYGPEPGWMTAVQGGFGATWWDFSQLPLGTLAPLGRLSGFYY